MSYFFLAFPKNAQKNNAREVAKISLAFSLAFILQSHCVLWKKYDFPSNGTILNGLRLRSGHE
jgi:hypothetical protein